MQIIKKQCVKEIIVFNLVIHSDIVLEIDLYLKKFLCLLVTFNPNHNLKCFYLVQVNPSIP